MTDQRPDVITFHPADQSRVRSTDAILLPIRMRGHILAVVDLDTLPAGVGVDPRTGRMMATATTARGHGMQIKSADVEGASWRDAPSSNAWCEVRFRPEPKSEWIPAYQALSEGRAVRRDQEGRNQGTTWAQLQGLRRTDDDKIILFDPVGVRICLAATTDDLVEAKIE